MYRKIFCFSIALYVLVFSVMASSATIYTPEGMSLTGLELSGTPAHTTAWAQGIINNNSLDATIIDSPTRAYNCHGYAWAVTEDIGDYWIQYDHETRFYSDDAYSNDGDPSYDECSSSVATHTCYETSSDHSTRVIQGGYPESSSGSQTHVSKWNDGPLVRHAPAHDAYALKNTNYLNYYKLKTTHGGTLSNYPKTWIGAGDITHTLTSNTTVSNSLTIKSDCTVDLDGYYLKRASSSATITEESSVTVSPRIQVNDGSTIIGYFPTIASALSNASSGETVHIYSSRTLSSNLTVPSGVTLKFESGSTTTLNGYKITTTSGSLYMNGGSVSPDIQRKNSSTIRKGFYPTIASAITDASSGDDVYLGNATYTEDVDMPSSFDLIGSSRTSTIINGDVTFDGVSSSKVSNLAVNGEIVVDGNSSTINIHTVNAKDIIDVDLGSSHDIWNVKTENSGYIELYCTSPLVDDIDSRNSETCGITTYGSDFAADEGYYENKSSWAIYCTSSSDPELIDLEFCGNSFDIYVTSGCTVDATGVTWFSDCPAPTGGSGTVNLPGTCSECPGALAKSTAGPLAADDSHINTMGEGKDAQLFYDALNAYRAINAKKRADRENGVERTPGKYASDYQAVANKMKTLLTTYPESPYAVKALRYIDYSNRSANRAAETSVILKNAEKSKSANMRLEAKRLIAADLQRQEKYAEAILVLDDLAETVKGSEDAIAHIYRKGVIYQKYLDDFDNAAACFSQVIDLDAESPIALNAQRRLDKMERDYQPGASQEDNTAEEALEFAAHNYPNPANPGTSIQYALPQDGHVSIRIYNINGQQVAELLSADMPAGRHQVRWDGRSAVGTAAATGMYFYRVEFDSKVLSHKFLLLR